MSEWQSGWAWTLLILSCLGGVIAACFNSFGNLIIFSGVLCYALLTDFKDFNTPWLAGFFAAAIISEWLEPVLTWRSIQAVGGSKRAFAGSWAGGLAGGVLGSFVGGVGMIPGVLFGIFLGAFFSELRASQKVSTALKTGFAALAGVAGSVFFKLIIALMLVGLIVLKLAPGS